MNEDLFIAKALRPLARFGEDWDPRALADDAALFKGGGSLVITKDVLAEGVHFPRGVSPSAAARRALRTNLSDLAAKGAMPAAYMLGLVAPKHFTDDDALQLAEGLDVEQRAWAFTLLGGDTVVGGEDLILSVTMFGNAPACLPIPSRKGARPGDAVYVTGSIGDAALGLRAVMYPGRFLGLEREHIAFISRRFWLPEPRLSMGTRLPGVASASADISDGLLRDLLRVADASGVGMALETDAVPFSPAMRCAVERGLFTYAEAASGGDDYEIIFCAAPEDEEKLLFCAPCPVHRIGFVIEGAGLTFSGEESKSFAEVAQNGGGYIHEFS